jgi:hypothetical protein
VKKLRGPLTSLAVLLLALVIAEFGMRSWLALQNQAFDPAWARVWLKRRLERTTVFRAEGGVLTAELDRSTPALCFDPYAGAEGEFDARGAIRNAYAHRDSGAYQVLVVGGSVAEQVALNGTNPGNLLTARFLGDPRFAGREVVVLNGAHWGYKQPQQLARVLRFFQLGLRPDLVVDLDGANEAASSFANVRSGVHPEFPCHPLWGHLLRRGPEATPGEEENLLYRMWELRHDQRRRLAFADRHGLTASVLLLQAVMRLDESDEREYARAAERVAGTLSNAPSNELDRRQHCGPPCVVGDEADAARHIAQTWFDASVALDAVCRARGVRYVHLLQPSPHYARTLSARERELAPPGGPVAAAIQAVYPLLREKGAELAARGVEFVDLSGLHANDREDAYVDDFHPSPAGLPKLSGAVADALLGPGSAGPRDQTAAGEIPASDR